MVLACFFIIVTLTLSSTKKCAIFWVQHMGISYAQDTMDMLYEKH